MTAMVEQRKDGNGNEEHWAARDAAAWAMRDGSRPYAPADDERNTEGVQVNPPAAEFAVQRHLAPTARGGVRAAPAADSRIVQAIRSASRSRASASHGLQLSFADRLSAPPGILANLKALLPGNPAP